MRTLATGNAGTESGKPSIEYYVSAIDEPARAALKTLTAARKAFVMALSLIHISEPTRPY